MSEFKQFEKETACADLEELKRDVETIEEEQQKMKASRDNENDKISIDNQIESLDTEIEALEKIVIEEEEKIQVLEEKENTLQQEFGDDLRLEPIPLEAWSESNTIERPYWEANLNPDKEMVEGYKGRYFELSLKNADKNAIILFPVGRYYIDKKTFRKKYGVTIGSFVAEALYYLSNNEAAQVRLFIQGSADIVGSETFRGKMNGRYLYETVELLPSNDKRGFSNQIVSKEIPRTNFMNSDLPNLRAQYLKEIMSLYTDKFDPTLLEGIVTETEDEKKRNTSIYLFFPDDLLNID
ncbi:MAG: hypothetical protein AAF806_11730 [Bacteroidota bacterium]